MDSMYRVRAALNCVKVSAALIALGRVFHNLGANTEKESSYSVWNLLFADLDSGGTIAHRPLLWLWKKVIFISFGAILISILKR